MNKNNNINIKNENPDLKKKKDFTAFIIIAIIGLFFLILGAWLINSNKEKSATGLFEKALEKINEFDKLTNIYSKQEMEKEIINLLDQPIARYPNTIAGKRALYYKGYIFFNTQNYEKAEKVFNTFINKYKNNYLADKAYYFLSYCYSENNKINEAIELLKNFNERYKNSYFLPAINYRIANLYEQKGNKDEAVLYYQKIIDEFPNSAEKENAKNKLIILKNNIKL